MEQKKNKQNERRDQTTARDKLMKHVYRILLIVGIISMIWYLGWRAMATLPFGYDVISFTCGIIMLIGEISAFFESLENFQNLSRVKPPEKPAFEDIPVEQLPNIDVLIATHNEPIDLLRKTVNGCLYMDYPDKSKVHIFLCDDGDRPAVAQMAQEMGVGYLGLSKNKLAKAGNLNNAIAKTTSPLLATFDADMIPMHSFLTSLVPYFFIPTMIKGEDGHWAMRKPSEIDPQFRMGFIQAPQSFYNEDLFQYNLYQEGMVPNEQDFFFREINVGRNRSNAPIYAGSNTIITREALASVGGIVTGTITEDFATGLLIQEQGFTCYAVPEIVANGLAPNTVIDLIKQRERWGRGCVQTIKGQKFLIRHKLPLANKISYWNCFLYWWTFFRRFLYIFSPIIFVLFNLRVMVCDVWGLLIFWLPSFILFSNSPLFDRSRIRTKRLSNVIDTILFPYMMIPIFLETIGISQRKFNVTKKDGTVSSNSDIRLAVPHLILLGMSLFAIALCVINSLRFRTFGYVIVAYWLIVNTYYLIMSVFFMFGRLNQRKDMRYIASLPVTIHAAMGDVECQSVNISEGGICCRIDQPIYLSSQEHFSLIVQSDRYKANMQGRVRSVRQDDEGYWLYGIACIPQEETDELQFYQLIHDREHTLPQYVDKKQLGLLQDININIVRRQDSSNVYSRKTPRIPLHIDAKEKWSESHYYINDFNYRHMRLFDQGDMPQELTLEVQLVEGGAVYELNLAAMEEHRRENQCLYHVKNMEDLTANPAFVTDLQIAAQYSQDDEETERSDLQSFMVADSQYWSDVNFS